MGFLYWLESIRNPVLDVLMQFFTLFGEELLFMVLALAGAGLVLMIARKRRVQD